MAEMPSNEQVEAVPQKLRNLELIAAILLGLATMLTAYAAYRGSIVSDGVLQNYSAASAAQAEAYDAFAVSDKFETTEQTLFLQFMVTAQTDAATAGYIQTLMGPEMQTLMAVWAADPTEPISPFMGDYPELLDLPSAIALEEGNGFLITAKDYQAAAQKADDEGDVFELSSVFLAVTLFLAGVATLLKTRKIQRVVLLLGSAMLVIGTIVLIQAEMT